MDAERVEIGEDAEGVRVSRCQNVRVVVVARNVLIRLHITNEEGIYHNIAVSRLL